MNSSSVTPPAYKIAAMSARRPPLVGRYTGEELALAGRNRGMPLEALRYDVTPAGLHYLLIHFDIPAQGPDWTLAFRGSFDRPFEMGLKELESMPSKTQRVTMECAGNGRAQLSPRYPSVPWLEEGVSTAEWTGAPLAMLLARAGLRAEAQDIVFRGADRGFDRGVEHEFARSLKPPLALRDDVLLAYAMNGAPLPPQHGAPLRLVVPGWYGMASVKWLYAIEALERPFEGLQQASSYHFRAASGEKGEPCTLMRVNSLMIPPGMPDFYTRARMADSGTIELAGRAWSGAGPIARVELGIDGAWRDAVVEPRQGEHAWQRWSALWRAQPGEHELACRATDSTGARQPLEPPWDLSGFGNNGVQRIRLSVR
jgi:DMSO/TMAO reductase YedYZ molybdopterin-dependent catalytic subunit